MLKIKRRFITEKWFYDSVSLFDIFNLVSYRQSKASSNLIFLMEEFFTIHINLYDEIDFIFKNFSKNSKYEIRRAYKEGVVLKKENIDIKEYVKFYNNFADAKRLSPISVKEISYYWKYLIIFIAYYNKDPLVINSYIIDRERARLFHSISIFRIEDENRYKSNFYGFANRALHFEAIKYFKSQNYKIYDLGGITKECNNGIDKFKLSFSKNIVKEYNFVSLILYILKKIKKI